MGSTMSSSRVRHIVVCAVAVAATSCAARRPEQTAEPRPAPSQAAAARADSLETFIGKVRTISSPPARSSALTLEAQDPVLAKALLLLEAAPSAARHRAVADAYLRLGISDQAHEHLSAAVKLEPRDAASWDRMARIWRDWGLPHLGLTDAHRAVYFAPASPAAHNTLGTILHALGRREEARARFERALQLDPTAAYALNNLCYTWTLEGQLRAAVAACQRAHRHSARSAANTQQPRSGLRRWRQPRRERARVCVGRRAGPRALQHGHRLPRPTPACRRPESLRSRAARAPRIRRRGHDGAPCLAAGEPEH